MNVLVLGGNGYLGNKICSMLANRGDSVICTIRDKNIRDRDTVDNITKIPASVDAIESMLKYMPVDVVVNAVCNYGRNETLYGNVIDANIEFPLKVLDYVVSEDVGSFITIGTGLPDNINMYSYTKKIFSEFGKFYSDKHGIGFCNLKLEMLYGEDEPSDRFLPSMIRKMIIGEDINITMGTQHRDIIDVKDVLHAIEGVTDLRLHGYNEIEVGTGIAPTIMEIIDFLWQMSGGKSKINRGAVKIRKEEPDCVADLTAINKILNWNPVFWEDGLQGMYNGIVESMRKEKNEYID